MLSHQRMGDSLLVVVVNTHDDERAAALPLLCGATSLTYTAPPYSPAAGSTWLLCRRRIDGQESATGQFCFCVISILLSSNGFALPPPLLTHLPPPGLVEPGAVRVLRDPRLYQSGHLRPQCWCHVLFWHSICPRHRTHPAQDRGRHISTLDRNHVHHRAP